jgi:hypothetical protein
MTTIFKWPPGIDLNARKNWVLQRKCGRQIRAFLVMLTGKHRFEPDVFAYAADQYISGLELSLLDDGVGPLGRPLCRLARAYARRFHREIVDEARYFEFVRRHALLGQ